MNQITLILILCIGIFSSGCGVEKNTKDPDRQWKDYRKTFRVNSCLDLKEYFLNQAQNHQFCIYPPTNSDVSDQGMISTTQKYPSGQSCERFLPLPVSEINYDQPTSNIPQTNVQENGVDEADIVKMNSEYMFVRRPEAVEVLSRNLFQSVQTIALSNWDNIQMYASEDRLIILGLNINENKTKIHIYKYENNLWSLLKEFNESGTLLESRLTNGRLLVLIQDYLKINYDFYSNTRRQIPQTIIEGLTETDYQGIDCQKISGALTLFDDRSITKLSSINIANPDEPILKAGIIGATSHTYVSLNNVYIINYLYNEENFATDQTIFSQLHLPQADEDQFISKRTGSVEGIIYDRMAVKEWTQEGVTFLGFATTTSSGTSSENHLSIFKEASDLQFEKVGHLGGMGPGETIRSVRYDVDKVYIVTYENMDPLYIVSINDPSQPTLLGELKVPGFSTYLHKLTEDTVLGVGSNGNPTDSNEMRMSEEVWRPKVKISLFDINDPAQPLELDSLILGEGYSYSEATYNLKAFFHDPQNQIIAIPFMDQVWDDSCFTRECSRITTGAKIFKVTNTITEIKTISHRDWIENEDLSSYEIADLDVRRVFVVDGVLMSFSQVGVQTHDLNTLELITQIHFDEE